MTNEIFSIKRGIKSRLESIPGLRAITFEPQDWRDFPVAIIRLDRRSASRRGVSESRFAAEFAVTVMAGGSKRREAYDTLDSYIASVGEKSVEAAIKGDRTLGGAVDWAHLAGVSNIGIVKMGGGRYAGADFRIRVEKRTGVEVTLELDDGSEVIDLMGEPYFAGADARFTPVERVMKDSDAGQSGISGVYAPRTAQIELAMRESSAGQIRDGLNRLDSVFVRAETLSRSEVKLRRGYGDTNIEYRALWGRVELLPASGKDAPGLGVKLSLSVEALGRLPVVESSDTLRNEREGANRNYVDISHIPGAHGALAQIRILDPTGTWSGTGRMWIGKRSGEGRADNLFFQGESGSIARGSAPFKGGGAVWAGSAQSLSEVSGGERARMAWTKTGPYTTRPEHMLCGSVCITVAAANIPRGRFRVLGRVRTETDNAELQVGRMGFALGWSFGAISKTPDESDAVFPQTASEFRTLDLGELTLPPTPAPEGYSTPEFSLDVHGTFSGVGAGNALGAHHFRWSVDYVALLPIDEGEVVVNGVNTSERVLLDTLSETGAGVYLLDEMDVILGPADFEGVPFTVGPEDTRIYVARDDPADPSGVTFKVGTSLTPLAAGV